MSLPPRMTRTMAERVRAFFDDHRSRRASWVHETLQSGADGRNDANIVARANTVRRCRPSTEGPSASISRKRPENRQIMRTQGTLLRGGSARNRARHIGIAAIVAAMVFACGPSRLPAPPFVAQPTSALVEVPYPPPPARPEFVPDDPGVPGAVWIDGEWTWQGQRWSWKRGRWVVPPKGASYAPWTTVRNDDGVLYVAQGAFRDGRGAEIDEPDPIASGRPNRTAPERQRPNRGASPTTATPATPPTPQSSPTAPASSDAGAP